MAKQPLQVLLVEDNIDQLELTIDALKENNPGIQIIEAHNGSTALEKLGQAYFDIAILDYSLPDKNGIEVLQQIKEKKSTVPVIMVTGQGAETIAVEAMKQGAQDYIVKTANYYETLTISIERVIEQNQMKKDLEEASIRSRRLYEILLSVTKERKIGNLSEQLIRGASELIGAEKGILLLIDSKRSEVIFTKSYGIEIEEEILLGPVKSTGLLAIAYTGQEPVVIEEPQLHPQWEETPWLHSTLRQILSVPLSLQGKVAGMLCVMNKENHEPISPEDVNTLSTLAVHTGVAIDNARFLENIQKQALTDSLTGLYNHLEFQKRMKEEIDRGRRYDKEFSLLMLDIDHFKTVNDTYGHQMGDKILKETSKTLSKCLRSVDIAFRYGGEEFSVLLPETFRSGAKIIAERIRQEIADLSFSTVSGHGADVTISIGIASFPIDADNREDLISVADQALFSAKRSGRNRVALYNEALKSIIESDQIKLDEYVRDPQMKTLRDLAAIIDAKSPYTKGHTEGVLKYAMYFADALNLNQGEKKNLEFASLLHNIGMVSVPSKILSRQKPLSVEERKIIQAHPSLAQMLIEKSEQFESVLPAILYHHERHDGHGYPNGLVGDEIPLLARILSVVDSFNAMISVRSYRPKLTKQQAIEELRRNAGTQFDPEIVARFTELLENEDTDSLKMEEEAPSLQRG